MNVWIISTFIILAAIFFAAFYIFNIYEINYSVSNKILSKENPQSVIDAIPLNSFGERAPFREVPFEVNIVSGQGLIEVLDGENKSQKIISIKADSISGEIEIDLKSEYDLFPVSEKFVIK